MQALDQHNIDETEASSYSNEDYESNADETIMSNEEPDAVSVVSTKRPTTQTKNSLNDRKERLEKKIF